MHQHGIIFSSCFPGKVQSPLLSITGLGDLEGQQLQCGSYALQATIT